MVKMSTIAIFVKYTKKKNLFCKSLIQNPKVSYLRNVIKINPINFLEEKNIILVSLFSSCNYNIFPWP